MVVSSSLVNLFQKNNNPFMMDANSDEDMNADSFVKPATQNSVERDIVMLKTDQTQEQLEQSKKYVHSPEE